MGTFQVSIEVGDERGLQFQRMEAVVDTGATYLVVPMAALIALGCQPIGLRTFKLADDYIVEYEVGEVSLRLNGQTIRVLCVFGDEGSEPLLGAVPLGTFSLAVDPVNGTLIPVPGKLK